APYVAESAFRDDGVGDGEQFFVAVAPEVVEASVDGVVGAMAEGFAQEQVVIDRAGVAVAVAISVAISVSVSVSVAVAVVGFQQRLEFADYGGHGEHFDDGPGDALL